MAPEAAQAIVSPAAIPAALSRNPSVTMRPSSDPRLAPTAARTASSRSRCATE